MRNLISNKTHRVAQSKLMNHKMAEQSIESRQALAEEDAGEGVTSAKSASIEGPSEQDNNDLVESMLCGEDSDILGPSSNGSQRYFINRLYQPMNGADDGPETLADDEYLFYQELRFFESTVQELTGGCEGDSGDRVSFSKILQDDELEDDVNRICDEIEQETEQDLHLTTIIDSFNHPFHDQSTPNTCTPPLIESSSDPMMTEACHEKPDSSTRNEIHHLQHQQQCQSITQDEQQSQFACNNNIDVVANNLQHPLNDVQETNFVALETVEDELSHHHHHHHHEYDSTSHHLQDFHQNQLIEDHTNSMGHSIALNDTSSLQQQVSSSFASPQATTLDDGFSASLEGSFDHSNLQTQLQHNNQTSHIKQQVVMLEENFNEAGKRYLQDGERLAQKKRCQTQHQQQQHSPLNTKVTSSNNYAHSPLDSSSFRLDEEEHENGITITTTDDEQVEDTTKQPPQMVKYRRRTANARERIRMREINQAFERLKKVVPVELIHTVTAGDESDASSKRNSGKSLGGAQKSQTDSQPVKLTKITTLRLAVSYISKLSELLQQQEGGNSPIVISSTGDHQEGAVSKSGSAGGKQPRGERRRKSGCRSAGRGTKASEKRKFRLDSNKDSQLSTTQTPKQAVLESSNLPSMQLNQKQHPQNIIIATTNGPMQQVAACNGQHLKQHPPTLQMMHTYSPQPLRIMQPAGNQQNRTFVTPVAVAILGIQTTGNQHSNSNTNEPQPLQLVGLHSGQQLHHQRQQQQQQPTFYDQPQPQSTTPAVGSQQHQYNLISASHQHQQQPQQLTFTLNGDMTGLSLLRLANTKSCVPASQLHCQPIVEQQTTHQQPVVLENYATYQPVRISHPTLASPGVATSGGEVQTTDNYMDQESQAGGFEYKNGNKGSLSSKVIISEQQMDNSRSNTGKISGDADCENKPLIRQLQEQQQQNNGNLIQTTYELKPNQRGTQVVANGSLQLAIAATSTGKQVIQHQQQATGGLEWLRRPQASHIIYLSPSSLSRPNHNGPPTHLQQLQVSQVSQGDKQKLVNQTMPQTMVQETDADRCANAAGLKFTTSQFSSQPSASKLASSQEANIRQLVASLTTSIGPNCSGSEAAYNSQVDGEGRSGAQTQRQQLKRTYRFHNYDGTMITNHLYGSNHQNEQHHQSTSNKRAQQHQVSMPQTQPSIEAQQQPEPQNSSAAQRSRQNSLSSTCSTTSSSSSSLMSSSRSSLSPAVAVQVVAIKSPGESSATTTTVSS